RGAIGPTALSKQAEVAADVPLVAQPGIPARLSQLATRLADFACARAMPGSIEQSTGGALALRAFMSSQDARARVQPAVRPLAALPRTFWHASALGESVPGTAGGRKP